MYVYVAIMVKKLYFGKKFTYATKGIFLSYPLNKKKLLFSVPGTYKVFNILINKSYIYLKNI